MSAAPRSYFYLFFFLFFLVSFWFFGIPFGESVLSTSARDDGGGRRKSARDAGELVRI